VIDIKNLTVKYGVKTVYNNFNLQIGGEGVTCILGESGCGKTTLLNAVAGLIDYGGEITTVTASYVFQSPRLIPYLTVLKNLTLTGADEESALKLLKAVGLADKIKAYPQTLSGGEARRVALCRAFLKKADVLLMDEPFSSLDLKNKLSAMNLFNRLREEEGRRALFVTHDIDEALYLADRIIILNNGAVAADMVNDNNAPFGASSDMRENIVNILLSEAGEDITKTPLK